MAGFGENLRREREMRGISLQEISDTTRVSVRFLQSLEEEDFAKLPGGIFIRSFIRAYANYLGLDEERVMAEYQLVAPAKGEEDFSRLGVTGASTNHKSRAPILPWVVAIILLAAGYAIFRYSHRSSEAPVGYGNPPPASQAASMSARASLNTSLPRPPQVLASSESTNLTPVPSTPSGGALPGRGSNPSPDIAAGNAAGTQDLTKSTYPSGTSNVKPIAVKAGMDANSGGIASSGNPPTAVNAVGQQPPPAAKSTALATAESHGSLVLQIAATERAWVSVKSDGKTVLQRVLSPNDVRTLTAKNSFDVTTGNAQGTVLTLNGVTLRPLGRYGEVKMAHLTRDDIKDSNP
ncbi:MAG: helix-turn-helix domain-containing protein [Terriglobia bacterium]